MVKIKFLYSFTVICCHSVSITATGASTTANSIEMGKYDFYKKSSNGWPVYERIVGQNTQYLYLSGQGYWTVGCNL